MVAQSHRRAVGSSNRLAAGGSLGVQRPAPGKDNQLLTTDRSAERERISFGHSLLPCTLVGAATRPPTSSEMAPGSSLGLVRARTRGGGFFVSHALSLCRPRSVGLTTPPSQEGAGKLSMG